MGKGDGGGNGGGRRVFNGNMKEKGIRNKIQ